MASTNIPVFPPGFPIRFACVFVGGYPDSAYVTFRRAGESTDLAVDAAVQSESDPYEWIVVREFSVPGTYRYRVTGIVEGERAGGGDWFAIEIKASAVVDYEAVPS